MNADALFGAGAVPLIAGIIQVFKSTGIPTRVAPLAALVLGVAAGLASVWQTGAPPIPWGAGVVLGLTWGLAASGLYQGGKIAKAAFSTSPNPYPGPGAIPGSGKTPGLPSANSEINVSSVPPPTDSGDLGKSKTASGLLSSEINVPSAPPATDSSGAGEGKTAPGLPSAEVHNGAGSSPGPAGPPFTANEPAGAGQTPAASTESPSAPVRVGDAPAGDATTKA